MNVGPAWIKIKDLMYAGPACNVMHGCRTCMDVRPA
jgi:hypothetical protein